MACVGVKTDESGSFSSDSDVKYHLVFLNVYKDGVMKAMKISWGE